jgi:DCN1-like protein 1/2
MNRLKPDQKNAVEMFMSFTDSSEARAIDYLGRFEWNVERAADEYFINPPPPEKKTASRFDKNTLLQLFLKYAEKEFDDDDDVNCVQGNRLRDFFVDLSIDPETDLITLILPWQLNCKKMFYISKEEFMNGFERLKCEKMADIKNRMGNLKAEIIVDDVFRQFYRFTFLLARGNDEHKKCVAKDMAVELWKLLLTEKFKLLPEWLSFVEHTGKAINADVWNLLLDFSKTDISTFDPDECWPVMIDDFVNWYNENKTTRTLKSERRG